MLVNTEFEEDEARRLAVEYARLLGQQPAMLRSIVREIVIHDGTQAWGGGARYDDGGRLFGVTTIHRRHDIGTGFVGEVIMHEAGHSLLDFFVDTDGSADWADAVMQDEGRFVSEYGKEYPMREDVTESFLAWFAVRYRSNRMSYALTR